MKKSLALAFAITSLAVPAAASEPLTATVKVACRGVYDYVVLGEHPKASDGFDNAYDTISPGNLNADMGEPFVTVVSEPGEGRKGARELRGDVRLPAKRRTWRLAVSSSLPEGTPLEVTLVGEESSLPAGARLYLSEGGEAPGRDFSSRATLPAPGPGRRRALFITVEQP